MKKKSQETPQWIETLPEPNSFRSVFKWGAPDAFKNPSSGFLKVIQKGLAMADTDFAVTSGTGEGAVPQDLPSALNPKAVQAIEKVVGRENISLAGYERLKYASGKAMEDLMRLRQERVETICDLVVHPRSRADVAGVVNICHKHKIPVHVYGGGSSVTFGLSCPRGGVILVMSTHMNQLIEFNETDQTIVVEPGMMGPVYEEMLNQAPKILGAQKAYTGGHFPQSFEFSSVGGWIAALGSGQASSLYGDAADLVIAQEYVTPAGSFKTLAYPATATGPKVNEIMKGSEGSFGVLVSLTLKVFEYLPQNNNQFAFMFPDFKSAVKAGRTISQGRFGMPAIFRISDAEETDVAMEMYHLEGGILDKILKFKGMKKGSRCLVMGQAEGEKGFADNVTRQVKKISRQHKGMYLTGYPMKKWYHGRFSDPYMRDALNDYGVLIDTLECSTSWENLHHLHQEVRAVVKARPDTICMTHASHFYGQGTNLYFIFITRMTEIESFRVYQQSILDAIERAGGSLSHHHGVGRMMAPFMERHLGKQQMDILRALKAHLDPNGIMNPGGLGLGG
ncbi:MAG: FAD-binding oxidoreductase [Desulfobacter sp.]|nr:FAD-binding oxidoreductase [Desulfobacter sp.]WDP87059.1 MAG: FAD-binding oxidoreductase [Desulfobacter sp.]